MTANHLTDLRTVTVRFSLAELVLLDVVAATDGLTHENALRQVLNLAPIEDAPTSIPPDTAA